MMVSPKIPRAGTHVRRFIVRWSELRGISFSTATELYVNRRHIWVPGAQQNVFKYLKRFGKKINRLWVMSDVSRFSLYQKEYDDGFITDQQLDELLNKLEEGIMHGLQ